ncbi:MAG TPA: hypothetical protein H9691_06910 [Firmicutes bacterium]|nr:hypothetical protein [Bacillota bacterium]
MKTRNKIAAAFFLLLITVGVMLLPVWMARPLFDKQEEVYWTLEHRDTADITRQEVAQLYCQNQYAYLFYPAKWGQTTGESPEIRQESRELLQEIFGKEADVNTFFQQIAEKGGMHLDENSMLLSYHNTPLVVQIISVSFTYTYKEQSTIINLLYEQKTGTLLQFSFESVGGTQTDAIDVSAVEQMMKQYVREELKLRDDQFSVQGWDQNEEYQYVSMTYLIGGEEEKD